jgi:hypothetical protein
MDNLMYGAGEKKVVIMKQKFRITQKTTNRPKIPNGRSFCLPVKV